MKFCRRCGARLASDHLGDEWCSPCLRARRDYDPKEDPAFLSALLFVLCESQGQVVEPLKVLGLGAEHRLTVKAGVRALRCRGHVIRGTARATGYVYVGYVPKGHIEGQCSLTAPLSA